MESSSVKFRSASIGKQLSTFRRILVPTSLYRVIHNSLRDFRLLPYSSRYSHAEGEHVNRGRDTPSFSPTLQVLVMSTLCDAADGNPVNKFLSHTLQCVAGT